MPTDQVHNDPLVVAGNPAPGQLSSISTNSSSLLLLFVIVNFSVAN